MAFIRRLTVLAATGAGLAGVGLAGGADAASLTGSSPGYHYFWKQGATMEQHDAALVDCAVRTRAMVNGSDAMGTVTAATGGGLVGALIGGIIDSNENRQGAAANTEGCMAIKGWSVVALTEEEGLALEQPDDPATIHEKLRPYVEAPSLLGTVWRGPFANEVATGSFQIGKALDLEEVSMSVRATRDKSRAAVDAAGPLKPAKPDLPKGVKTPKDAKALKANLLAGAQVDQSYIVLRTSGGKGAWSFLNVIFNRLAEDGTEIVYDGKAVAARTNLARTAKGEDGGVKYADYVMSIPPGLWKMGAIVNGAYVADFCFGAPVFAVGEGEVISIGVLTAGSDGGYPLKEDHDAARAALVSNPALAEKVKAAEWTNGYTSDCFGSYAYAYEIPGAPFVDMAALARSASAAPASVDAQPSALSPDVAPPAEGADVTMPSEPGEDE